MSKEITDFLKMFREVRDRKPTNKDYDQIVEVLFRRREMTRTFLIRRYDIKDCENSTAMTNKILYQLKRKLRHVFPLNPIAKFEEICTSRDAFLLGRIKKLDSSYFIPTLYANIKSGVLVIFLRKLMGDMIEQDLSDSLDFNSLVRLSLRLGGKKIEVPTYDKVESLLVSALYSYMILVERASKGQARTVVKKELGISVQKEVVSENLSKLALLYSDEINTDNSDISSMFRKFLRLVTLFQKKMEESVDKIKDNESLLKMYNDMNLSFLTLTKALYKVSE